MVVGRKNHRLRINSFSRKRVFRIETDCQRSILEMFLTEKSKTKKIVFSGDVGLWNVPIIEDPTLITEADYVLIESTYGDRVHEKITTRDEMLLKIVKEISKNNPYFLNMSSSF